MAESNPRDCERDPATPDRQDVKVERAALAFLIDRHPDRLTTPPGLPGDERHAGRRL